MDEFQKKSVAAKTEITGEVAWNGLRLVLAHDPATALEQQAKGWVGNLDGQDLGPKKKGRKLSESARRWKFASKAALFGGSVPPVSHGP